MHILSIELDGIRSYRKAHVDFPLGITLLSGDIGAGKSTLLLAIEFALFGLSRSDLVGGALLRHGANGGSVTLAFSIRKRRYRIQRSLKRTGNGIVQDNGWLESDGGREALTPSELRARVFGLLGYPLQFLGKQRNILYRFTIYTPQEEMKAILAQDEDERVETIRRIFGIDAYRIARDNAHLLSRALKERETAHEAVVMRIKDERERVLATLQAEAQAQAQQALLLSERQKLSQRVMATEQEAHEAEAKRAKAQQELQVQAMQARNRQVIEQEITQLSQQRSRKERVTTEAQTLERQLRTTHDLLIKESAAARETGKEGREGEDDAGNAGGDAQERTQEILALLDEARRRLEQLRQDEGKVLGIIEQCRHAPTLKPGDTCPTCRQVVPESHIDGLRITIAAQAEAARRKHEKIIAIMEEQRKSIAKLQQAADRARQISDLTTRIAEQERLAKQHAEELALLDRHIEGKRQAVAAMPRTGVDKTLEEEGRRLDAQLAERRMRLQQAQSDRLELEKRLGRVEQELRQAAAAREQLVLLERDLLEHEGAMAQDSALRSWLGRQFSPFTANVERHVLLSIHATFDAALRQWFSRLLDDDTLSCRIDAAFAPVMLQNGYETDVAHLSGGERTSVSLAYRLALVNAIHALLPHIGTAGLIMLDEPTDGFSSEQLERVRDVLRDLAMDQIILVSHEQQLEGFVDHILRVRKAGDGSVVELSA